MKIYVQVNKLQNPIFVVIIKLIEHFSVANSLSFKGLIYNGFVINY